MLLWERVNTSCVLLHVRSMFKFSNIIVPSSDVRLLNRGGFRRRSSLVSEL
jgi:hypothetical protein